jgi:hypothetical protein
MRVVVVLETLLIWMVFITLGSAQVPKNFGKVENKSDKVAADEEQSQYPAFDLEDLCKQSKNPKCEAIVDRFCLKSCSAALCAHHGSIRGMCRLMCEAEDLPPQCLKMGPSKGTENKPWFQQDAPQQWGQQWYPQGQQWYPFQ